MSNILYPLLSPLLSVNPSVNSTVKTGNDINLMDDHISGILITISKNPVTNVVALAGTGKSTDLPLSLANSGNKIAVLVSDSGIAKSLSDYLKTKTNLSVNNNITVPSDITYISRKTMKDYIMKDYMYNKSYDLTFADILMIDEADSESLDQTMIELLWRYSAEKRFKIPRLLLVSSTPIQTNLFDIEYYLIPTIRYPIEIRYSNKDYDNNNQDHSDLVSDVIDLIYETHMSSAEGDILVFATSESQADSMTQLLKDMKIQNADVYAAHKSLSKKDVDEIYEYTNNRRIVIADSLAETTFTLRDVGIIIDMMIDYKPALTLTGGLRYPRRYITKHQANIRSSRGGLYQPLLSYRMITRTLFNKLRDTIRPHIYNIPLHYVMLELIENNIDPYEVLNIFPTEQLNHNYSLMLRLGVINTAGKVTILGDFTRKIPFGLRNSVTLYRWINNNGFTESDGIKFAYPAIVLLSMIDSFGKSYFVYPLREKELSHAEYNLELLEHRKRHFNPFEGVSDIHTYSNIWNIMLDEVGGPDVPSSDIIDWCEDNSIRYENILGVMSVVYNVINIIESENNNDNVDIGPFDTDNTLELLGPILKDIYSDREFIYDPTGGVRVRYVSNLGDINNNNIYYNIDSQNSINSIERELPEVVYALITSTISSNYGPDFNLISCSLI